MGCVSILREKVTRRGGFHTHSHNTPLTTESEEGTKRKRQRRRETCVYRIDWQAHAFMNHTDTHPMRQKTTILVKREEEAKKHE